MEIRKPTCRECAHEYIHTASKPVQQNGVTMQFCDRFCTGGKRPRRFCKGDPKIFVPAWCPKRKDPCEVRIYGFYSSNAQILHAMLCYDMGHAVEPSAHRYAMEQEFYTKLTPREFWKRCKAERDSVLLGVDVQLYYVVEIDDGLRPVCFYKTEKGYQIIPLFDVQAARKNHREE